MMQSHGRDFTKLRLRMKPGRSCALLILVLAGFFRLGSQARFLAVEQVMAGATRAQMEVNCVWLGSSGFLWIGSQDGLLRYDGYRTVSCRLGPAEGAEAAGLPVRGICEDRGGRLWLATARGLVCYDPTNGAAKRFRHDPRRADTLSADDLTCLTVSPAQPGRLWVASAGGDLDDLDLASGAIVRHPAAPLRPGPIHALCGDGEGVLWVGAAAGLFCFLPEDGRLQACPLPAAGPGPQKPVAVKAILCDPGSPGILWVGSDGAGLLRYLPASGLWQRCGEGKASSNPLAADMAVNAIAAFPGEPQNLILGTDSSLYRFEPGAGQYSPQPLFIDYKVAQVNQPTRAIYRDPQGTYWFATRGLGLYKWSPLLKKFTRFRPYADAKPNPLANWVTSMQERGGNEILVTTYGGGVLAFDRRSGAFRPLLIDPGRPGRKLNFFVTDSRPARGGGLWFSTAEGMALCSASGRLQKLYSISAGKEEASEILTFVFIQDRRGLLWIGTDRGLVRLDPRTGALRRFRHDRNDPRSLSHDRVNAILEESGGSIWVGSDDGLNLYQPAGENFAVFRNDGNDPASLGSNQINFLMQDSLGRTWICTSSGLDRLERKGGKVVFRHFPAPGGDPGQNLFRSLVEENSRRFWVSTSAGLARFDSERPTFTFYDRRDGVDAEGMGEAFFGMRSRDGEIFFAGRNGFTCFRPAEIAVNLHPPPVVATGYGTYDSREEVAAGGLVVFRPRPDNLARKKILRVEFAALDFMRPEKNQYAYRLEGRDPDWIYQGTNRVVLLEGLEIGKHTLYIKAANNEGFWNEKAGSMPINVRLSYWEQWRFVILAALLLAALAAALFWSRRRLRRLRAASIPPNLDRVMEKYALSKREAEILRLLLAGKSNKEIEDALFIAMATVKIHVHNIFRKVKVGSRLQLLLRVQREAEKLK
jgi:ligand-binding sensor domain-containing protein/DNA-binding CsgD family transcriptional regulator